MKSKATKSFIPNIKRFYETEGYTLANGRQSQSEKVQELITELEMKFQEVHPEETEEEQLLSAEGIESVVCKNMYDHIFNVAEESEYNLRVQ